MRSQRRASSRAMPSRRRRDGATVPACTRGSNFSVASGFRCGRRHLDSTDGARLSRGGIRDGSWPERECAGAHTSRTVAPATRVPGAPRGGHARHRSRKAYRLLSSVSARGLLRQVVARRPRCGNASKGQRNRHRLVPARSGARAPLACEDRGLVRVCPCVVSRLQKSASVAKANEKRVPGGNGARER